MLWPLEIMEWCDKNQIPDDARVLTLIVWAPPSQHVATTGRHNAVMFPSRKSNLNEGTPDK